MEKSRASVTRAEWLARPCQEDPQGYKGCTGASWLPAGTRDTLWPPAQKPQPAVGGAWPPSPPSPGCAGPLSVGMGAAEGRPVLSLRPWAGRSEKPGHAWQASGPRPGPLDCCWAASEPREQACRGSLHPPWGPGAPLPGTDSPRLRGLAPAPSPPLSQLSVLLPTCYAWGVHGTGLRAAGPDPGLRGTLPAPSSGWRGLQTRIVTPVVTPSR